MTVIGLDPEGGVLQGLDDGPFEQDPLLFGIGVGVGQSAFLLGTPNVPVARGAARRARWSVSSVITSLPGPGPGVAGPRQVKAGRVVRVNGVGILAPVELRLVPSALREHRPGVPSNAKTKVRSKPVNAPSELIATGTRDHPEPTAVRVSPH